MSRLFFFSFHRERYHEQLRRCNAANCGYTSLLSFNYTYRHASADLLLMTPHPNPIVNLRSNHDFITR
jgi:hypothetical protein